jgi:hypothetical protein
MKIFCFVFSIFLLTTTCSIVVLKAQSTWVSTQYIDYYLPAAHFDSTNVGPKKICLTPNQTIISLMQINQNGDQSIYALDSLSSIKWNHAGSPVGGIYSENCSELLPTMDNGCVYIFQHINIPAQIKIIRLNPQGGVQWSKTYNEPPLPPFYYPLYIIPTFHNTFYVKFNNDSLVELNDNGNYIRSRTPFTGNITALPDSDFIVTDASQISRQNFSGSQVWSIPSQTFSVAYADSLYIYAHAHANVKKLKSSDGSLIWSIPATNNEIAVNAKGEFVSLLMLNNQLTKYDSSGIIQWTKTITLPNYKLTSVSEGPDFTWITGGCWRNRFVSYPLALGYSPMVIRLNNSGNGTIDSTDYFFVGNANDNSKLSFADDAVYIAGALSKSGVHRDSLLRNDFLSSYGNYYMNVFATDWLDSYPCGINFKYCDVDGNGIIDTVDIRKLSDMNYSFLSSYSFSPHWVKISNNSLSPQLKLSFENNILTNLNDTIHAYVTLGSGTFPTDSIYGISLEIMIWGYNQPVYFTYKNIEYFPSAIGDTLSNLFFFKSKSDPLVTGGMGKAVSCRTDNQNVVMSGDTIIKVSCLLYSSVIPLTKLVSSIEWSAISNNGCSVPLTYVGDTLLFLNTNISENETEPSVYFSPQPANDYINIISNTNFIDLKLFNSSGQLITLKHNPGKEFQVNIKDYSEGIYYFLARSNNKSFTYKFIIIR